MADAETVKSLAHDLECARAAYGVLIERARAAGKKEKATKLTRELANYERRVQEVLNGG